MVVRLMRPFVVPTNKMQMTPRLMMAALIIRSQAKSSPRDGECNMFTYFPETLRAHLFGMDPGPHSGGGPGGIGKTQSANA